DGTYDTLFTRPQPHIDPEFDITAMIDVVSLMNLYFLITFVTAISIDINLPAANHAAPLDADVATIITVIAGPDANNVVVYHGKGHRIVSFAFHCTECGRELKTDERHVGRRVRCPDCATLIVVPDPASIAAQAGQRRADDPNEVTDDLEIIDDLEVLEPIDEA